MMFNEKFISSIHQIHTFSRWLKRPHQNEFNSSPPLIDFILKSFDIANENIDSIGSQERSLAISSLTKLERRVKIAKLDHSVSLPLLEHVIRLKRKLLNPSAPQKLSIIIGTDPNGALTNDLYNCLTNQIPVVITPEILSCGGIVNTEYRKNQRERIEKLILNGMWTAYQQIDRQYGEQFIVCVPRHVSLDDLDLNSGAISAWRLKPLSDDEILKGPTVPYRFEALLNLLHGSAVQGKLIEMNGHGGYGTPFGLNEKQLHQLLNALKHFQCRGLSINSCFAGGKSTLSLLSKRSPRHLPFPLLVRSIGEYTTTSCQPAEWKLKEYFHNWKEEIEQTGCKTIPSIRRSVLKSEESDFKAPYSLIQAFFPQNRSSAKDTFQGFRAICEQNTSFSLTFTQMRATQISHQPLTLQGIKHLILYPLEIEISLSSQKEIPIIISGISGQSHHYIQELRILEFSFQDFLKCQREFYKENTQVYHAFFIHRLVTLTGIYHRVTLFCTNDGRVLAFYQKDHGHFQNDGQKRTLTSFSFGFETLSAHLMTIPMSRAVMLASGGNQERHLMQKHFPFQPFSGEFSPCNPEEIEKMTEKEAMYLLNQLSTRNKGLFLQLCLLMNCFDLAEVLIRKNALPLDTPSAIGNTTLHLALERQASALTHLLLIKPVDLKSQGRNGWTPLQLAFMHEDREAIDRLIELPELNLPALDHQQQNTFAIALMTPHYIASLVEAGGDINQKIGVNKDRTALSMACMPPSAPLDSIQALLNAGADPNLGSPTPLVMASLEGNEDVLNLLLQYGADPFAAQDNQENDFQKILLCAPRSILFHFINREDIQEKIKKNASLHASMIDCLLIRNDIELTALMSPLLTPIESIIKRLRPKDYLTFAKRAEIDWNQPCSGSKSIFHYFLERSGENELWLILLQKGARFQSDDPYKIARFAKTPELLKAFIDTHGPLSPEVAQIIAHFYRF